MQRRIVTPTGLLGDIEFEHREVRIDRKVKPWDVWMRRARLVNVDIFEVVALQVRLPQLVRVLTRRIRELSVVLLSHPGPVREALRVV